MRAPRAVAAGLRHAIASPGLVAWLLLVTFVIALPDTLLVREAIRDSIGASLAGERLRERFDMEWYSDYRYTTDGIGEALTPTSVRPAAFLDNLEAWFSGELFLAAPPLVAVGVLFALVWSLMLGGILHRFVHEEREFALGPLLARGGGYFFRFVRLMALAAVAYYGVYRFSRWLFPALEFRMRDVTVERTALTVYLVAALLVVCLLLFVKLVSDYAKVATVVEGRRSMLLAAWRGLRFVLRHPVRTGGAYATIALLGFALLWIYWQVAPGLTAANGWGAALAFVIAQAFLALRILQRLAAYGAALEIYRGGSGA